MFEPRLTIPDKSNKFYIAKSEGGLNPCIAKPAGSPLRFANCVFYAAGRFAEITGIWLKSTNAENFVSVAKEMGLTVSDKPQPGAIAVWAKGKIGDGSDGAGHVAVVEIINQSGSIVTSESGWNAKKEFWTQTRKNDGNWGQGSAYRFIGFILPPASSVTVLRKGDRGEPVKRMQTALADRGYLRKSEIDGDFGTITLGALLAFQLENGLEVDGIAGPKTAAALGI
jgi:murein L,D-transpeptidase YcbB/YkuD